MARITITGLAEAQKFVTDVPQVIARRVILDMSQIAYDRMQEGAGRHTKTGALFDSVYNKSLSPLSRQVGHDERRAPHARFILHGTKDHKVAPKDKKALRWAGNGKFFFSKGHMVKGIVADNYLETAAAEAVRQMPAIVDRAMKEL